VSGNTTRQILIASWGKPEWVKFNYKIYLVRGYRRGSAKTWNGTNRGTCKVEKLFLNSCTPAYNNYKLCQN